jgi:hypothetical protein
MKVANSTWRTLSSGTTGRSSSCSSSCVNSNGCTDSDCLGWGIYCASGSPTHTSVSYAACESACAADSNCYGFTSHGSGCGSGDNCYMWTAACSTYGVTGCGAGSYYYTKYKLGMGSSDPFSSR